MTFLNVITTTALLIDALPFAVRGNYEDGGTGLPRKHDFTRSESENWRTSRDDQNGEDDEGGWRLAGSRRDSDRWCPPSPGGRSTDHISNTFIFDKSSWINVFVLYHHSRFCVSGLVILLWGLFYFIVVHRRVDVLLYNRLVLRDVLHLRALFLLCPNQNIVTKVDGNI